MIKFVGVGLQLYVCNEVRGQAYLFFSTSATGPLNGKQEGGTRVRFELCKIPFIFVQSLYVVENANY